MPKKQPAPFEGFSKKTVQFFKDLEKNNNKEWFDKNRETYEQEVKARAESFVVAMGDRLKDIAPTVNAEPRVNRSIFKINRDIRFSKDKTPYKTHLAVMLWDGGGRMESPSFYFHLSPNHLMLGMGMWKMDKKALEEFRKSIDHPKHGPEFDKIVKKLAKKGIEVKGKRRKQVPRGFDKEHKYKDYLLHDGVTVGEEMKLPKELYSEKLVEFCFKKYKEYLELEKWLVAMTKRAQKKA